MRIASRALLSLLVLVAAPAFAANSPKPPCTSKAQACLEKIGRIYIDALLSHDGSKIPLADKIELLIRQF